MKLEEEDEFIVLIPWNSMTQADWQTASANADDIRWEITRDRAWKYFSPEAIKFIYNSGTLTAVRYILPSRPDCGWGYKGHGMTTPKRIQIEFLKNSRNPVIQYDQTRANDI